MKVTMTLFGDLFYSGPMLAVFSDENRLQRMLDFEGALAIAEASLGVIPADASRIIADSCRVAYLDVATLRADAAGSGNLAIPLVKQLTRAVTERSTEAARYVHWGATSQDAIDTGLVLQMREALALMEAQMDELIAALADLAERHSKTAMAGRTWLQHAVPISFGWKVAGWLDAMLRHRIRLAEVRERALTLQLGGAAGTLASLGTHGEAVAKKLAERLQLSEPEMSWHSSRDRIGEVAGLLGLMAATLGKVARDVSLLMQSEVGEVFEGGGEEGGSEERGGSSTMPQKRNPVGCAAALAAAVRVPGLVATVLSSMAQEHERGVGNWQAEWETIPEIFNLCSGSLQRVTELIKRLEVDEARMAANLELTHGLIYAEAVSMALASQIGRGDAHALVQRACREAIASKRHLRDWLMDDVECGKYLSATALAELFDPARYLGVAPASIARVVARARSGAAAGQSGSVSLSGARMHFTRSGNRKNPVLVLSHSLGADGTMWEAQAEEFSKHFDVLRYDTRGHGKSSVPAGPYTMEQLGRDVLSMLDELGIESCFFCGISMGGMIGQWLGLHGASRVRKLVLSNTAAKIGTAEGWGSRMAAVQASGLNPVVESVLERWFTPRFRELEPGTVAKTRATIEATNPAGYVACCAAVRDADFRAVAASIAIPTLVIGGTHDVSTPPADSRSLADAIGAAEYVELNAAHLSNIEAAGEFNAAVLKFLLK